MLPTLWLAAATVLAPAPYLPVGSPVEVVLPDYGAAVRAFVAEPPAWNRTLVNVARGTGRGAPERRDGWYRKHWLWLDSVDRSSSTASNDFLEHRGIFRDWSGQNQHQETLHFRGEGARELLIEHGGIVRDEQNRPVLHPRFNLGVPGWAERRDYDVYLTTQTAPRWHAISNYDWVQSPLFGDAISQDNIGGAVTLAVPYGDIDDRKFRSHLERTGRLPRYRERGANIRDDLAQRLAPKLRGLGEADIAKRRREDPVLWEYWRFQHLAHLYQFSRNYRTTKDVARSRGRDYDVHGNQAGFVFGFEPYQGMVSDFVDSIWLESAGFLEYDLLTHDWANAWGPFRFEMAEAMAGEHKPVMASSYVTNRTPDLLAAAWAEASAGGGVLMLHPEQDPEGSPQRQRVNEFLEFRDSHRALFERPGRRRYAQVAMLYSIPTALFDQAVRDFNTPMMRNLGGVARALEEGHVPFDMVLLDDPEFRPDRLSLGELERYRVVILPAVALLSDRHAGILEAYLAGGGTLVLLGTTGERDERGRLRKASLRAPLRRAGRVLEPLGRESFGYSRAKRSPAIEARWRQFSDAVRDAVGQPIVEGALPSRLWVKTWRHGDDLLSFHFVNTDLDPQKGKANPTAPTRVSLRLPEGFEAKEARWLVPGRKPRDLSFDVSGGRALLELPGIDVYGVLVLGPKGFEERESFVRRARRHLLRVRHAGAGRPGLEDRIARVEAVRSEKGEAAFGREAQRLLEAVAAEREADYLAFVASLGERPEDALWAFDFGAEKSPRGWTRVAPNDEYTPRRGWGWLSSRDGSSPTPEDRHYITFKAHRRDTDAILPGHYATWPHKETVPLVVRKVLWSGRQHRFRVNVPDGRYRVTVLETFPSSFYWGRLVSGAIAVNERPVLLDTPLEPGSLARRTFDAEAVKGRLDFRFGAATGWGIATLVIEPLPEGAPLAADPLAAGGIRSWTLSPRHPNPEWFPLDEVAPPAPAVLDGTVVEGWTPVRATAQGMAWVDLGDASQAEVGDVVYARAVIERDADGRAQLELGATSSARAWWNGEPVASLPNLKGLTRAEGSVEVPVRAGTNILVVELERFWERRWMFYASLMNR